MTAPPGFAPGDEVPGHTLPPGLHLREYRIDKVLGEGGFGIVYLAFDTSLERRVAIKEYLPNSMAARAGAGTSVVLKSPSHAATFAVGLRSFVNEARLLARFDHPALVKVHQFWEANGTAYMVMPYYEGPTLKAVLADLGRLPTEAEVRRWLLPLMDALAVLHGENCYHRDIAPDNILITPAGPLLLDFGAARRVIGDLTHALTAVLKPGYAPIEQYGEMPGMGQGPWTDIFALASVLYVAISGVRPVPAVERLMDDRLRPLAQIAAGRCRPGFLGAVDKAMALRPEDRPRSIAAFRLLLDADGSAPMVPAAPMPAPVPPTVMVPSALQRSHTVDIGLDLEPAAPVRPALSMPARAAGPPARAAAAAPGPARSAAAQASPAAVMPPVPARPPRAGQPAAGLAPPGARRRSTLLALAAVGAAAAAYGAYRLFGPHDPAAPTPVPPMRALPTREPTAAPRPARTSAPTSAPVSPPTSPPAASRHGRAAAGPNELSRRDVQARCAAVLRKASRETLGRAEIEFLRKECR